MVTLSASQRWWNIRRQQLGIPLAACITAAVLLGFIIASPRMWHWFVVPTLLCGLLISGDAARWLNGTYDLFDPKGIIGVFGWFFFFLAPLLFIHWDIGISYPDKPADWRPWVGYLGALNVVSIMIYQMFQRLGFRHITSSDRSAWTIDIQRATPAFLLCGGIALGAQAFFFARSGGIAGVIDHAAQVREAGRYSYTGLGLFQLAGGSLPFIALMYLTLIYMRQGKKRYSLITVGLLLLVLTVCQFIIGGFSGSRSTTVWSVFIMAGIIHHFWRRFTRRNVFIGLVVLLSFLYIYGFYKSGGTEAIDRLTQGASVSEIEADTGRSFQGLIIGDLARVDTQSYQLYHLSKSKDYDLRWGKTYLDAFTRRLPSWIWSDRPIDSEKVIAGTELFLGKENYIPGDLFRTVLKVYGLAGEAMLNFGILSAPLPFVFWGYLIGRYRRMLGDWGFMDARWFLAPLATLLITAMLFSDSDNITSLALDKGGFVLLLILLALRLSRQRYANQVNRMVSARGVKAGRVSV